MSENKVFSLELDDLAELFGGTPDEVAQWTTEERHNVDLTYRRPAIAERDQLIIAALKRLEHGAERIAGKERLPDWEAGWKENLEEFKNNGFAPEALIPKYIRPNQIIRLFGDYALPNNPHFARDYTRIFRAWLAQRFFSDADAIYEFGCGPGSHVAYLAQTFPDKPIVGLDWAKASQDIMQAIATHLQRNVSGRHFDFFTPDRTVCLPQGTVALTFGALEQVGEHHNAFIDYLLACRPRRVVHVEGINELYQPEHLLDYLALHYHRRRNYLWNLLSRLKQMEKAGMIVIETVHRQHFGSQFNDTYSTVVWRPA